LKSRGSLPKHQDPQRGGNAQEDASKERGNETRHHAGITRDVGRKRREAPSSKKIKGARSRRLWEDVKKSVPKVSIMESKKAYANQYQALIGLEFLASREDESRTNSFTEPK